MKGMKMKFTVINNSDIDKYVPKFMVGGLQDVLVEIEEGRLQDGKKPNTYVVINTDEPYIDEVVEILKRNGDWGEDV